jgi:hypothetical protein
MLLNPPFADDPPIKLNVNAKILGIVIAVLSALGILALLGALTALLGLGVLFASLGFAGILPMAFLGILVGAAADVASLVGGWRMYQGNADGKRLVIYALAIGFLGQIVTGFGYASFGNVILPVIVILVVYYLVVISRFPGATPQPPPPS